MPTPLSLFVEKNPEYTIARIARDMHRDKGHVSRIATGVIFPRPETRLALEIATNGGVPASAWAEPGPRIRRDLPSYSFRFVKEGDPVLYCALDSEGRTCWWGPYRVEQVKARGFTLVGLPPGAWFSKVNGWAGRGSTAWLIPMVANPFDAGEVLLLDGANGSPRERGACGPHDPSTGLLTFGGGYAHEGTNRPPARLVPANWPHLAAYTRNRRFPFNV